MRVDTISKIVNFWLGTSLDNPEVAFGRKDWWYKGGTSVDNAIRTRFGELVSQACAYKLSRWQSTPEGALALVLLLDQFTRNIYRNTPQAYLGDARAFEVVTRAVEQNIDTALPAVSRIWLYHPYHHAENLEEQDKGLALLNKLQHEASEEWKPYVKQSIDGWTRHREIVARFGRFPHRNAVLARDTTKAEKIFLETNDDAYGQGPKTTID